MKYIVVLSSDACSACLWWRCGARRSAAPSGHVVKSPIFTTAALDNERWRQLWPLCAKPGFSQLHRCDLLMSKWYRKVISCFLICLFAILASCRTCLSNLGYLPPWKCCKSYCAGFVDFYSWDFYSLCCSVLSKWHICC